MKEMGGSSFMGKQLISTQEAGKKSTNRKQMPLGRKVSLGGRVGRHDTSVTVSIWVWCLLL